jgi:hypothetical protein
VSAAANAASTLITECDACRDMAASCSAKMQRGLSQPIIKSPAAMEDEKKFAEQMLGATFEFAKLAISSLILLNAGAATALLAFIGSHGNTVAPTRCALLAFTTGAGVGGFASMLAYLGQRLDWAVASGRRKDVHASNILLWAALICVLGGYLLFFVGCVVATRGMNITENDKRTMTQSTPSPARCSALPSLMQRGGR